MGRLVQLRLNQPHINRQSAVLWAILGVGCQNDPGIAIVKVDARPDELRDTSEWPEDTPVASACPEAGEAAEVGPWADVSPLGQAQFEQGCTKPDAIACYSNELPTRVVDVGAYEMMTVEVSQELWLAVMGDNPATFADCGCGCPVETVSWFDAVAFANALSTLQGLSPAYTIDGTDVRWDRSSTGWRLPTEAEWERASKGNQDAIVAGNVDVTAAAWYRENSDWVTHPTGLKEPTAEGVHDLNGNVWEWVWDWTGPYSAEAQFNPTGPDTGEFKVVRGGSYVDDYRVVRSSVRRELPPDRAVDNVGVRLVRGDLD